MTFSSTLKAWQTDSAFQHFQGHRNYLVSDPNTSLRTGDVVRIEDADRQISRHIRHVINEIITPWGTPLAERPPVLTAEERTAQWKEKYDAKIARRKETRRKLLEEEAAKGEEAAEREGSREARDASAKGAGARGKKKLAQS